ncbi:MAG: hydroxylamine reductase, partial [Candidatus Omnitrophica bacterium]|nr:hydroxylamine reductase [Candidatus Omnitrophota bacterium]
MDNKMFCFQCEEAQGSKGCTVKGTCGKDDRVANLMDTLVFVLKGISFYANQANQLEVYDDQVDKFLLKGLFVTVTNVNFSEQRIYDYIKEGLRIKDKIKKKFLDAYQSKEGKEFNQ